MKKLLSIFFVALMFFPNALEISHILADENHKIECENTKVHIHEDGLNCNLITFLNSRPKTPSRLSLKTFLNLD